MAKSNDSLPEASFVPTCFFGDNAKDYFSVRDYSKMDSSDNVQTEEYRNNTEEMLQDPDYYRYPRCKLFSSKPTSIGICHTFNAYELETILKPSKWTNNFLASFAGFDDNIIMKNEGVNVEKGFVFSLDSMQSFLYSLQDEIGTKRDITSFLIQVHPSGEIPWMRKEKQNLKRISAMNDDMSTRFITIKNEDMITSEVGF